MQKEHLPQAKSRPAASCKPRVAGGSWTESAGPVPGKPCSACRETRTERNPSVGRTRSGGKARYKPAQSPAMSGCLQCEFSYFPNRSPTFGAYGPNRTNQTVRGGEAKEQRDLVIVYLISCYQKRARIGVRRLAVCARIAFRDGGFRLVRGSGCRTTRAT